MRNHYAFIGLALALAASTAHAQTPAWTGAVQPTNPTPTDDTGALGVDISLDAANNQYVTGVLQNGGGSGAPAVRAFGSTTLSGGTGLASGFVAKLSPTQQWLWAVKATSNGQGVAFRKSTVSPAGDTYASGGVQDDATVSPNGGSTVTVGSFTYLTTNALATFVTRLNASGQPQWVAGASGGLILAQGWDATAGNLVVVGSYTGTIRFGSTTLTAAPYGGIFVARLDASGQWMSALNVAPTGTTTTSQLQVYSCAVGPQGQVGINFRLRGGQVVLGATTVTSSGSTDRKLVVAQLSAAGAWQWATVTASDNAYYSNNMQYDRNGNIWLLADAASTPVQFGTTTVSNGEEFVGRLSTTGQWGPVGIIGLANGSGAGYTPALTVDAQGNAVVAGALQGAKTFGTTTLSPVGSSNGNDQFVARYGAGGQWQFAQLSPAATTNSSYNFQAITLDVAGNLLATGQLRGTATFGTNTLTNPSISGGNVFVAKLANAGVVLGVRQAASAAPIALYPNPSTAGTAAMLRLAAPAATALRVVLRDALGRTVAQPIVAAGSQEVAVATQGLAPGLYLLEASSSRAQLVVE